MSADTLVADVRNPDRTLVERRIPGEAGLWVLILGDLMVFAVIFGSFMFYRGRQPEMFRSSQAALNADFGVVNTVVLLISSLLVVIAVHTVRTTSWRQSRYFLGGAMVCGAIFSALKFVEYGQKIAHGIVPTTNEFYVYYYVMTGLHFLHLAMGMAVLAVMTVLSMKGPARGSRFAFIEGGACFWHMVDLLWIVLFPLVYLVR